MAEIEIRDTGRGIAPEHRQRIFQLFFTTRPGGSGIGLASTFRTVQLHNGSIEFESEVGRGTMFRITLPLAHQLEPSLLRPGIQAQPSRGAFDAEISTSRAGLSSPPVMAGCANKHIVRASPPSVSTPPPDVTAPMPPPQRRRQWTLRQRRNPRPRCHLPRRRRRRANAQPQPRRPAPTETAEPAPAKPAAPQISPQLSARDLEATKRSTTSNITTAEQNCSWPMESSSAPRKKI